MNELETAKLYENVSSKKTIKKKKSITYNI